MRSHLIALVSCLTLAASAHAQVLFSNFGPSDSFDTLNGYVVAGTGSITSYQAIGVTFVPASTASLASIDLSATHFVDTNSYLVTLAADNGGQPGAPLETWTTAFPGTASLLNLPSVASPLLSSSVTYWLTVEAGSPGTFGTWNFNNQGGTGFFTQFSSGGAWLTQSSTSPVYRINGGGGTAAPEPGTVALLGLGLAAGITRRRRRG